MGLFPFHIHIAAAAAALFVPLLISSTGFAQNSCAKVTGSYYKRETTEPIKNYFNPKTYLMERNRRDIFGQVETEFSKRFDTRFYYTGTSPKTNTDLPFQVDPEARAVFLFVHGSGTAQSSGKNFYGLMNSLAKHGFSSVSLDLPFHGNGPHDPRFYQSEYFLNWFKSIVEELKKSGKEVIPVGHSYGPEPIAEVAYRFPFLFNTIVPMSPAGFDKVLSNWYDKYTTKMKFGGDVQSNDAGGEWAGKLSEQFAWNKGVLPDPTTVNPDLKAYLLVGDREEYAPAPIGGSNKTPVGKNTYDIGKAYGRFFKRMDVTVLPNVGHYIFNHTDESGANSVFKHLLSSAGYNVKAAKKLFEETSVKGAQSSQVERASTRYSYDGNFRSWVNHYVGAKNFLQKMRSGNEFLAKNLLYQYEIMTKDYEYKLAEYLISEHPALAEFQFANKNAVEGAKVNFKDRYSPLLIAFNAFAEKKSDEYTNHMLVGFEYKFPKSVPNFSKD